MKNKFEFVGRWWNDNCIELIKIDGEIYALHGWNGEEYNLCWKCVGDSNKDISKDKYTIRPIYNKIDDDEYEIIDYKIL